MKVISLLILLIVVGCAGTQTQNTQRLPAQADNYDARVYTSYMCLLKNEGLEERKTIFAEGPDQALDIFITRHIFTEYSSRDTTTVISYRRDISVTKSPITLNKNSTIECFRDRFGATDENAGTAKGLLKIE